MNLNVGWQELSGVVIAVSLLMLHGRSFLTLCLRETTLGNPEALALSFLIGAGSVSLLSFWLSPLFGVVPARWLLSLVTLRLAMLAWASGRRLTRRTNDRASVNPLESCWLTGLLSAGIAIQWAALSLVALRTSLGWDGLMNFEIKARMAFLNHPSGRLALESLSDSSHLWSHPAYPLLVPMTEFWIYSWIGSAHQGLVKLLFPAFYMSLAGLLYGISSRVMPKSIALLACFALGFLPALAIGPGAAITGYADVPLAAAVFGAVSFAYLALRTDNHDYYVLAALLSALAVWTKREGTLIVAYLLVAVSCARIVQARSEGCRPFAALSGTWWLFVVPAIVAVPWLWLQRRYGTTDEAFSPLTFETLWANLSRLPIIMRLFARELVLLGHWTLLWPVFVMALVLSVRRLREAPEQFLVGAVVVPMVLYALVFVFSSWMEFTEHVGTALPRLLIPLAPVALFVTIRYLRGCLIVRPDPISPV